MNFNIGGVPEHFNLPWHLAMENGSFEQAGITLNWQDYPGGTGAMTKALRAKELDIAIMLTEGIIADICNGNPSRIVQQFVKSPLTWGIHVGKESTYSKADQIDGARYAISRKGSGSHLMAFVNAMQNNWDTAKQQLVVVGGLEGAKTGLNDGSADVFLWEKFTTKPIVDAGIFNRIGELKTPWPCFVIAVREEVLESNIYEIEKILQIIRKQCADFMQDPNAVPMVADRYEQKPEDVKEWYEQTEWATDNYLPATIVDSALTALSKIGIIEKQLETDKICSRLCQFQVRGNT